jgi:hypothetical protein
MSDATCTDINLNSTLAVSIKVAAKLNLHNCYVDFQVEPKDTRVYQMVIDIPENIEKSTSRMELIAFCEELLIDSLVGHINKDMKDMHDKPKKCSIVTFAPYRIVQSIALMKMDTPMTKCVMTSRYGIF